MTKLTDIKSNFPQIYIQNNYHGNKIVQFPDSFGHQQVWLGLRDQAKHCSGWTKLNPKNMHP